MQGEPETFNQIIRQLNKLVDVVHAMHHSDTDVVDREMALFKVSVNPSQRAEIFQIVEVFRAKTVDITDNSLVIESKNLNQNSSIKYIPFSKPAPARSVGFLFRKTSNRKTCFQNLAGLIQKIIQKEFSIKETMEIIPVK